MRHVTVIGGANVDLVGSPTGELLPCESNPGAIKISSGGVGRNIAENLARLGISVHLLSLVGRDLPGQLILEDCRSCGIRIDQLAVVDGATPVYLALLDSTGDLHAAVSQMDLVSRIADDFIDARASIIEGSELLVVDANLRRSAIERLCDRFASNLPFFVDTVSATKARRLNGLIGRAHTIKPNLAEAEVLTGLAITDRGDLDQALSCFLDLGIERVVINLGESGLFFGDANGSGRLSAPRATVVNATGAGDAAMAALAYGYLEDMPWVDCVRFALAAALLTLSHEQTTHPEMGVRAVEASMGEVRCC